VNDFSNLPHGNRVERRYGSKILIQPFIERDEVNYYQSDVQLSPALNVKGSSVPGHSFDIGTTASCKLSDQPPKMVVVTILHEIADPLMWHFPEPLQTDSIHDRNQSASFQIVADGKEINPLKGRQMELKKDWPDDEMYYDAIFIEMPFSAFTAIAHAFIVEIKIQDAAFFLDDKSRAALKSFADIMIEGVDLKSLSNN
jgi:hypothetical protein